MKAIEPEMEVYDLIYSRADNGYMAIPRENNDARPRSDLHEFDSGPPSALYACTLIPTEEILRVLSQHTTKWGAPLTATRAEKTTAFENFGGKVPESNG